MRIVYVDVKIYKIFIRKSFNLKQFVLLQAMWSELAVDSFFPQSNGIFKQLDISKTIDFIDMDPGTQEVALSLYDQKRLWTGSARPGPTRIYPTKLGRKALWRVCFLISS